MIEQQSGTLITPPLLVDRSENILSASSASLAADTSPSNLSVRTPGTDSLAIPFLLSLREARWANELEAAERAR